MNRPFGIAVLGLLLGGCATAGGSRSKNEQTVRAFYDAALEHKDFQTARTYLGPVYTQHNPKAEDGPAGFEKFLNYLRAHHPASHVEVKRVFVDGDYVIMHCHEKLEPGDRGNAIVDIFRLENGRIVEHWDVIQPIPEAAANPNGMF